MRPEVSAHGAAPRLGWRRVVGALLVVSLLAVIGWTVYDARKTERQEAEQAGRNIALALEGDIRRAINLLDQSLRDAAAGTRLPGFAGLDTTVQQAVLFNRAMAAGDFGGLHVTDAAGNVLYSSIVPKRPWPGITEREFFRQLAEHPEQGPVMGRKPVGAAEGGPGIAFAWRISNPDDSFAGVAVAVLKNSYFDSLVRALDAGPGGVVSVYTFDGDQLARNPAGKPGSTQEASMSAVARRLGLGEAQAPASGSFVGASVVDGIERLYSYRQVGDLPLFVSVGAATSAIYADWVEKTAILGAVLLVLLAVGAALAWSLRHHLRERERAEAAAIASAREHAQALARLDTLFANSADSMLVVRVHKDGRLTYEAVNPVWQRLTGTQAAAAIGRSPEECLPPQVAADTLVDWRDCLRLRRIHRVTFRSEPPGIIRDWEAAIAPVFDEHGEIQRLVSIGRDITQRNAAEANLREAHRAEAIGQLTAGIAHDFNNLLQAIGAGLELLGEQRELDDEGRDCAATAVGAAHRAATLVHRLLAFSRKQALRPVVLDPARLLANLAPRLGDTLGEDIRLETRIAEGAWPVCIDLDQLENCLLNLALNARDAMPDGGMMRVSVTNAAADAARPAGLPAGEYTLFEVEDTGAGMTPDVAARALEPFFTTRPIGQGTGLGLSMVQGFARQSGGDVRLDSVPGRGTTVRLWLPRSTAPLATPAPASPLQPAETPRSHRVLVVDDESIIRKTLVTVLSRAGYRPEAAASGQEALEQIRSGENWDLLITDQSMPGMTGIQLIQHVAAINPGLPTMLMTGFDKVSGLDEHAGELVVLYKPFDRATLLDHVKVLAGGPPGPEQTGEKLARAAES